jgi:hypothetical protein
MINCNQWTKNVARIVDASLHQLETAIAKGDYPAQNEVRHATENVKSVGEALKSLADGLDSYRNTVAGIRQRPLEFK